MENEKPEIAIPLPVKDQDDPMFFGMRITKIVCSRTLKSPYGEIYQGMSMSSEGSDGLSIRQARLAALRLGLEVHRLVFEQAILGHLLPEDQASSMAGMVVNDYLVAIRKIVNPSSPEDASTEVRHE